MENHAQNADILTPDVTMMILTWVTFFIVLGILYKFAWKPILAGLDSREASIRKALEDADKATAELAKINESRQQILQEAQQKANAVLDEARKTAVAIANGIETKAKEETKAMVDAARHEIDNEKQRVKQDLRKECVEIAVNLATKIIRENLDQEKNRKLIESFIKEV